MNKLNPLIPQQKLLKEIEAERPRTRLAELAALVGEDGAAAILVAFAGDSIHFPTMRTINRIQKKAFARAEVKGLHKNGYAEKIKHLSQLLGVSERTIVKEWL